MRRAPALAPLILLLGAMTTAAAAPPPASPQPLEFEVQEGLNLNRFIRDGQVAAHLLLHSGTHPRILIVFPAGNSGVGVWLKPASRAARWRLESPPRTVSAADAHGRVLRGITFRASIQASELEISRTLLSSVRVLRDFQAGMTPPDSVITSVRREGSALRWERDRLDGSPGYRLVIELTHGSLRGSRLAAARDGRIGLQVTGLTGESPLEGLSGAQLLVGTSESSAPASHDKAALQAASSARETLSFLAYREKFLAGSWRFDTYFGRDTLMSVRLLLPVLAPEAIEAGLASVLARVSPEGEVAHEEDIGEFAVLEHLARDKHDSDEPIYDYKMIDGDYLLAPVLSAWLLDDERARNRARDFLAAPASVASADDRSAAPMRGAVLVRNLRRVVESAAAFADAPGVEHLIGLKSGFAVGNWRDSEQGLGGGRFPYDVNAVLVPAALAAVARLQASGLLERYETPEDVRLFAGAARAAAIWRERAPPLFEVRVAPSAAAAAIEAYARRLSIPAEAARKSVGCCEIRFHALALGAGGAAIPIMHSDEGFALLFGAPDAASLQMVADLLLRPFPAGLMSSPGLLVANPVYATPEIQSQFTRNAYHGTVVWSWQQALFAAGLARQLERADLSNELRRTLMSAQRILWAAIESNRNLRNSELWSWTIAGNRLKAVPFGAASADADESNAAQLWSTVYLAVRPPH